MNRLDLYTAVHKMQRARLFELTVAAGTTDPYDSVAKVRLAASVEALVAELSQHAEHEERFIHPVLRRVAPQVAADLDAGHATLDAELMEVEGIAARWASTDENPNALYRALASFTAVYLEHVAEEEAQAMPALWESCSDDELLGVLVSFKGSRTEAENLTSVLAQLPTMSPPEIARMVAVGLGAVPIASVRELLATVLDPGQLGAVSCVLAPAPALPTRSCAGDSRGSRSPSPSEKNGVRIGSANVDGRA